MIKNVYATIFTPILNYMGYKMKLCQFICLFLEKFTDIKYC